MITNEKNGVWQTYDEMDDWDKMEFRAYEGWKWYEKRRRKTIGFRGKTEYVWEYFIKYSNHNKNPQMSLNFTD